MSNVKTILIGAFVLAALLGGRPVTANNGQAPLSGGSCLSLAGQAPEPLWQTSSGCYQMSYCWGDAYCWELCPEANAASCSNNVCQFDLPGGGSGTSGGCPYQSHCAEDYHCVFPGGITGTCVGGTCVC
ncbi:MAG TPA: hypothetical protein VKM72_16060 [Thermoanaerobaculia bacterium]|nr:hypothetical protein [Thermoanaerobaculia bacterium]